MLLAAAVAGSFSAAPTSPLTMSLGVGPMSALVAGGGGGARVLRVHINVEDRVVEKCVALTPELTFESVLKTLLRDRASQFEALDASGMLTLPQAASVAHFFADSVDPEIIVRKFEI